MNEKNLDHLYHSRFSNLGVRPSPRNWERIFQSLEERRKRKRRAIILRASGMAAAFLLMLALAWSLSDLTNDIPENSPAFQNTPSFTTVPAEGNQETFQPPFRSPLAASTEEDSPNEAVTLKTSEPVLTNADRKRTIQEPSLAQANIEASENTPALAVVNKDSKDPVPQNNTPLLSEEEARMELLSGLADQDTDPISNPSKKWSVGPQVAPVYYSSMGGGSPLDPRFNTNPRSGKVNMSYGLSVAYKVSPKLKIRSGLHKVAFGYDTESVEFSASPVSASYQKLQNIDYDFGSQDVVVKSTQRNRAAGALPAKDVSALNPSRRGNMNQELAYLEIPLEVQYALVDKKVGIDFIGGFSSLILTGNAVSLESEDRATPMGEATNVNQLNLSSNLGLGLRYNINKGMQFHLEPVFKYHWNTFSGGAEGFRPYSMGLYSGFNIRF